MEYGIIDVGEESMELEELLKKDPIEILMYDFKEYVLSDGIMAIFSDKLYWKKKEPLKNWLRYKVIVNSVGGLDCDSSLLVQQLLERVFGVKSINGREYWLDGVKLESDTLNSLNSVLGAYIRKEYKWNEEYDKGENHYPTGDQYKFFFYLEKIDQLKGEKREIYDEMNLLALLTHTIGNYGLVPLGFNCYRGKSFVARDYYDLSLEELKQMDVNDLDQTIENFKKANKRKIDFFECKQSIMKFKSIMNDVLYSYSYSSDLDLERRPQGKYYDFTDEVYLELLHKMNDMILKRGMLILNRLGIEINLDEAEVVRIVREKLLN